MSVSRSPFLASEPIPQEPADWGDLLAAARAGDEDALGEICEQLREYLLLAAAGNLGRDLTAKLGASDIVQETMLEACRDFPSFQGGSEGEFRAWVRRLLQRNAIDSARSYRVAQNRRLERERSVDEAGGQAALPGRTATASSILRRRETDEQLLRAVARLPGKQQRVIELRHRDGLAYRDIATALGMTEVAARKMWSRAVQQLSRELAIADEPRTPKPR
jgi:RNA polymerase sigma-70 factor (ECF subfamily)